MPAPITPRPWQAGLRLAPRRGYTLVLVAVLLGITVFHLATLRPGFSWFDDVPAYVQHAQNIAEGEPYAATGYVQNPYNFIAPKAYPPGYPLLLAPLIAVFGVNVLVLKVAMIVLLMGALFVAAQLFKDDLPLGPLCALLVVIGLHPFFWERAPTVMSDVPFLLFAYLSLLLYRKAQREAANARRMVGWALLLAACVYYTAAIRPLGLILLPCFLAYDVLRTRRLSPVLLIVIGAGVVFYGGRALLGLFAAPGAGASGYDQLVQEAFFDRLGQTGRRVYVRLVGYARNVDALWANGYARPVQHALFLLSLPLFAVGFGQRVRRAGLTEVFFLGYALALLPWPFGKIRYLIPLIPLYFFYLFLGAAWAGRHLEARLGRRARMAFVAVALTLVAGTYTARYTTLDFGPIPAVFDGPAAQRLYAYVDARTAPDDVFVAAFPRQYAFFTDRHVSAAHSADSLALWRYADRIGAEYVIVGPQSVPWGEAQVEQVERLVEEQPGRFDLLFSEGEFALYRRVRDADSVRHRMTTQEER